MIPIMLFIIYSLVFTIQPQIETVGYSVHKLSDDCGNIDEEKLKNRINELKHHLYKCMGSKDIKDIISTTKTKAINIVKEKTDIVSGKDYLYPLICKRIKHITKRVYEDSFKLKISRYCDIGKIENSRNFVGNE